VGYPKDDIQMNGLYFGRNVDGGTFPADIWGDYMGRIKGSYCGDFEPPKHPFLSSPFYGKYSKSGGALTGGDTGTTTEDPDALAPTDPDTGGTTPEPTDEPAPEDDEEGFDPTQYESEPQQPPETVPPADPGQGGGTEAPPG
jgi:penicillin-binding protein 1A